MGIKFNNAEFKSAFGNSKQLPKSDLPEIVFSGRSNVGKSSLINKLVNRKSLARVSATPGKTGTINFYSLNEAMLVDLPGYGYAKVSFSEKERWAELVEGYFNSNRNISLVVQIIDMRHTPSKYDLNMIEYLNSNGFPFIIVMTKSDKLKKLKKEKRLEELDIELKEYNNIKQIPFSSVTSEGLEEVKSEIEKHLENK